MNSTSLNQIAQSLLNEVRGGRSSNTEYISLRQIKYNVKYYRALLLRRDFVRNANRYSMFEQDLEHINLEKIDSAESDEFQSSNFIHRTIKKVPSPLRFKNYEGFTSITERDKVGKPIPLLDTHRSYFQQFSKFTDRDRYATYRNGYIYVFSEYVMDLINIRGIFEDPEEVFIFNKESGLDKITGDEPFPISLDMVQQIKQSLLNGELNLLVSSEDDKITNQNQDD